MKQAAIGIRMHSGWGVQLAIDHAAGALEVIDRRRIVVCDERLPGAKQPYHHAESMKLAAAEKYLAECAESALRLASVAVAATVEALHQRDYDVFGVALLLASGRPLPPLAGILASHAMIHSAEGEFFRSIAAQSWERRGVPVTGMRERELGSRLEAALGTGAQTMRARLATMGKTLGPPWTADEKGAALAAFLLRTGSQVRHTRAGSRS